MKYRTFGKTGLQVSEIGLGALPPAGLRRREDGSFYGWTGKHDAESIALVHRAEELGVNLIDSAEGYGSGYSEVLAGRALKGRRGRWIIATKVDPNRGIDETRVDEGAVRKRIREACEGSLERLETDWIDLYQLHAVPHEWAMPATMETFEALRQEGKVRWYGISINDRAAIDSLRALGPVDVLQIGYNLLERDADALLHWAKAQEIGTLIRVPLAKGWLSGNYHGPNAKRLTKEDGRYERFNRPQSVDALKKLPQFDFIVKPGRTMAQAAVRFVLDHPGVSCVIAGAKTGAQIEENVAVCDVASLSDEELKRAFEIADTITTPGWIG